MNCENWHGNVQIGVQVIDHWEIAVLKVYGRIGSELQIGCFLPEAKFSQQSDSFQLRVPSRMVLMEQITG
jgi:hypothetical protein